MKTLDQFGQGRQSVIKEMLGFCKKEIAVIKELDNTNFTTHKRATITGSVQALSRVVERLKIKNNRLKLKE